VKNVENSLKEGSWRKGRVGKKLKGEKQEKNMDNRFCEIRKRHERLNPFSGGVSRRKSERPKKPGGRILEATSVHRRILKKETIPSGARLTRWECPQGKHPSSLEKGRRKKSPQTNFESLAGKVTISR